VYPFLWSLAWPAPLLPSCHLPVTDAEVVAIPRVVAAAAAAELVAPGRSATGTTRRRLPLSHAWRSGPAFPGWALVAALVTKKRRLLFFGAPRCSHLGRRSVKGVGIVL